MDLKLFFSVVDKGREFCLEFQVIWIINFVVCQIIFHHFIFQRTFPDLETELLNLKFELDSA